MTLSVVIITKNEEEEIHACLKSVNWADEHVVIDAESTDATVDYVKAALPSTYIINKPWEGFGLQKNFGIKRASSDWILILDADERVTLALRDEIQQLLMGRGPDMAAYRLPRRNLYWGYWLRYGGLYPDYQVRLFRKEAAIYNDATIHENLIVNGKIGTLCSPLDHYTERRVNDHFEKMDRYTTLAAKEKFQLGHLVTWRHLMLHPLITFCKVLLIKQGIRDGVAGVVHSLFASMYTFLKYAKLWELCRNIHDPSRDL